MTTMANLLQSTVFPQHFPWLLHHLVSLSSLCGFTHGLALTPVAACCVRAAYGFHQEMVMFHEIHQKSHEKWGFGDFHFAMDFHPPFINKSTQIVIFFMKNMVDLHDLLWISWTFFTQRPW